MSAALFALGWGFCCPLAYGFFYPAFRQASMYWDDESYDHRGAFWLSMWGPLSLLAAICVALCAHTGFRLARDRQALESTPFHVLSTLAL